MDYSNLNKYQTDLLELEEHLPKDLYAEIIDYIETVALIKHLIQPEHIRGTIKDRPFMIDEYGNIDPRGRKEIDITKPHILEDMDFFRERALFYEKNGRYTNIPRNGNPRGEYAQFWREELRRWKEGLVREDGEWVPGQLYFYWNYAPIWLVESEDERFDKKLWLQKILNPDGKKIKSKKKGVRVRKFPKPWLGDYLYFHYIDQAMEAGKHGKLLKTRGVGFPQPNTEQVITTEGIKLIGDITLEDKLIGRDGIPTDILEIHKQDLRTIYELEFTDGRKVRCDIDHLWNVEYKGKTKTKSTKELLKLKLSNYIDSKKYTKYYYKLPDIEPVQFSKKNLSIRPYLLGFLIGDGNLTKGETNFSTDDIEILDYIQECIGEYKIKKHKTKYSYGIITPDGGPNYFNREIKKLHLDCKAINKYIPQQYLHSSIEDRIELLKGLMDSDGSIAKNGYISFTTSSTPLARDFSYLCRSLGIKISIRETDLHLRKNTFNKEKSWQIGLSTKLPVFKLKRKLRKQEKKKKVNSNVYIKNIKSLGYTEECTCFTVNNKEHLYLTRDFVPTHNSFKMGSISPCNMYTKPGSGNPNFHLASDKTFLAGDKGVFGKVIDVLDWLAETTPLARMRLVDSVQQMHIQLGYKDEYGTRKGNLSSVFGISLKDNPDKARGIRGPLIHYEEDGLFPDLEKAWGVNRKAVEDGDTAFGFMLAGGTGGTEGASFEGSEKLFYSPGAYNIYAIPNVYDKNTNGGTECGFFWGAYMNRNNCYDEDTGEPDVIKALVEILANRNFIRRKSTDPNAITQAMAEEPIVPQEAVMRTEGTIFPVADLKEHLSDIMPNLKQFVGGHYCGRITEKDGKLDIDVFNDLSPIRDFPIKDNKNKEGCVEVFQKPYRDSEGKVPFGRYIAGCDPYDDDESQTNSLGSLFVMDTLTEQIVCEYTGRPRTAAEFYENVYRVLKYYNALCNYENDKKGLFSYFDQKNALYLLADNPKILKDMDMMKPSYYGNKAKGTHSGKMINRWGRRLQADWLLDQAYFQSVEEGKEKDPNEGKLNLQTIRSIGYLKELIAWNIEINADRVSAMGMLMILKEDRAKITLNLHNQETEKVMTDKFWDKHFTQFNTPGHKSFF